MKTIALFGTCGHHDMVLHDFAASGDAEFIALAPVTPDDDPDAVLRRHASWSSPVLYPSPEALLAAVHPDVVIVSSRLDRIAPLATLAARAGCDIIAEKPLALDTASLAELWRTVSNAGVRCTAMLANRRHPVLAAAIQAVRSGAIGRVVLLNARKSYRWGTRPAWFGDRALYGGTIPWIGIHALDFIHAIADSPFTSVFARHANLGHPDRPGCEDACLLDATLASGALASASLDFFRPAEAPTHGDDWIRVVGTRGVLEAALDRNSLTILPESSAGPAPTSSAGGCSASPAPTSSAQGRSDGPAPTSSARGRSDGPASTSAAGGCSASPGLPPPRLAFLLTQAALVARDSADAGRPLPIPDAPWL